MAIFVILRPIWAKAAQPIDRKGKRTPSSEGTMNRRLTAQLLFLVMVGAFCLPQASNAQAPATPGTAVKQAPGTTAKPAPPAPTQKADPKKQAPAKGPAAKPVVPPQPPPPPPPGYVIGPDDVLSIIYWREKDVSADVVVRPDGMISLPLLNDVMVNGLTPDQARDKLTEAAKKFFEDPSVTVVVKEINSRKVFITGEVGKPGPYALTAPTNVLQLISMAGGLREFAKQKDIKVIRVENGKTLTLPFNYKDVIKGKNLKQNIELRPGDTVIVP